MNMNQNHPSPSLLSKRLFRSLLLVGGLVFWVSGCVGFGKYGTPSGADYMAIKTPEFIVNKTKGEILEAYGVPDFSATEGEAVWWGYHLKSGYFIIVYGKTEQKDLLLKFEGDTCTFVRMIDKGESMGVLMPPGGVAH